MDVIGYIRVSTDEQGDSGNGLEAQRRAISGKAMEKGWNVVAWHQDVASGKSLHRRPELQAALEALRRREAAGLVVAKLDRLSRSVHDFTGLLELAQKQKWALVTLDFDLDTSTPQGLMVAHIFASFAEFERRLIGQRTKEGMLVVKARGPAPGKKAIGRPRRIGPELELRIRRLNRSRSLRVIAKELNEEGIPSPTGRQWAFSTLARVLNRA